MKTRYKVLIGILAGIGIAGGVGVGLIKHNTNYPATVAKEALKAAEDEPQGYYFPSNKENTPMIIFYPGAAVDVGSYSVWAKAVAAKGYPVYLVHMPLELAMLAPNRADDVLKLFPNRDYIIAGHSLGGAMASRYANRQLEASDKHFKGIIYMSSFSLGTDTLKKSDLPALVLTATKDVDITEKDVLKKKASYPKDAEFVSIKGGNHLGYGSVEGAKPGTISNEEQQKLVTEAILSWLGKHF